MKISKQLRQVAKYLAANSDDVAEDRGRSFICHAYFEWLHGDDWLDEWNKRSLAGDETYAEEPALQFLEQMGMDMSGSGFNWTGDGLSIGTLSEDEKQSARFMWLHFCADRAEEMGL